jgi:hypothetical protein
MRERADLGAGQAEHRAVRHRVGARAAAVAVFLALSRRRA